MIDFRESIIEHREFIRNAGLVLLMILITFIFLAGRGIIHFRTPDFSKIQTAAATGFDPEVMLQGNESTLRKNYGIAARDLENFVYYAPKTSMDASEILILQAKATDGAQKYLTLVENRRSTNANTFRNYRPLQAEILSRSYLESQGNYLIFISAGNVETIKDTVEAAFR